MPIFFAIFLVALGPMPANAERQAVADPCVGDGVIAETFMRHRQLGGYDINEMMRRFGSEPGLRAMVLDAYDLPRLPTKQSQQAMIAEFKNKWTVTCYRDGPAIPLKETSE